MSKKVLIKDITELVEGMNEKQLSTTYDKVLEISKNNIIKTYNKVLFIRMKNTLINEHDMTVECGSELEAVGHAIDDGISIQYNYKTNLIEIVKTDSNFSREIMLTISEDDELLFVLDEVSRWLKEVE